MSPDSILAKFLVATLGFTLVTGNTTSVRSLQETDIPTSFSTVALENWTLGEVRKNDRA